MARRGKASAIEDDQGQQEDWFWGSNNRGGCGAPLKDNQGNTITNLKAVIPPVDVKGKRNAREPERRRENDYGPPANRDRRHDREPAYDDRSPVKRRDHDDDYDNSPRRSPVGNALSPGKRFSALQDMHGANPREKSEKQRREMEYQNALRDQIEEKKRQKELEKGRDEETKRREYQEYMNAAHSGKGGNQAYKPQRDGPSSEKAARLAEVEDYSHGGKGRRPRPRDEEPDHHHQDRTSGRDREPRAHAGGRRGEEDRGDGYPPRGKQQQGYDSEDEGRGRGQGQARRGAKDADNKRFVSPEEYDELSSLCDRLMQQQEELQDELQQQASLIKELQRGAPAVKGQVNGNGRPPVIPPKLNDKMRSKSVQQARPTGGAAAAPPRRDPSLANQRPSSMHQLSNAGAKNAPPAAMKNVPDIRRPPKVAFGGPAVDKARDQLPKKKGAVPGLALNGEKAMQKVPTGGVGGGNSKAAGGARGGGEPGTGGFQKLQQRVGKVSGPTIVSYDDENDNGGGGGGGSGGLELRGQSRYVAVSDDDYAYPGGALQSDQLDKLLNNNRRGKFA